MLPIDSEWPTEGYRSITSDVIHKNPAAYLAELLMYHRHDEVAKIPKFWLVSEYKASYSGTLASVNKHMGELGFKVLNNAILKNRMTSIGIKDLDLIVKEIC